MRQVEDPVSSVVVVCAIAFRCIVIYSCPGILEYWNTGVLVLLEMVMFVHSFLQSRIPDPWRRVPDNNWQWLKSNVDMGIHFV